MRPMSRRCWRFPLAGGLLVGVAAIMAGCYPGEINSLDQTDIVVTAHDENADFQSKRTYVVPDTVVNLAAEPGTPTTLPPSTEATILERVRGNMNALGYTVEPNPTQNPPDVIVLCAYATADFEYWYYNGWCDWWYWYGYGCGGWGWYPGYDSVTVTAGMLLLTMLDLQGRNPDTEEVPVIWSAFISGILGSGPDNARVSRVINQSFNQSPYLRVSSDKVR